MATKRIGESDAAYRERRRSIDAKYQARKRRERAEADEVVVPTDDAWTKLVDELTREET